MYFLISVCNFVNVFLLSVSAQQKFGHDLYCLFLFVSAMTRCCTPNWNSNREEEQVIIGSDYFGLLLSRAERLLPSGQISKTAQKYPELMLPVEVVPGRILISQYKLIFVFCRVKWLLGMKVSGVHCAHTEWVFVALTHTRECFCYNVKWNLVKFWYFWAVFCYISFLSLEELTARRWSLWSKCSKSCFQICESASFPLLCCKHEEGSEG